jgi:hypothetical protein
MRMGGMEGAHHTHQLKGEELGGKGENGKEKGKMEGAHPSNHPSFHSLSAKKSNPT